MANKSRVSSLLSGLGMAVVIVGLVLAVMSLLEAGRARAQSPNGTRPISLSNPWQIKPQVLTGTSAVNLCSLPGGPPCGKDVYLCGGDVNTGSTATTVSIFDSQSTPVGFLQTVAIAANTTYPMPIGPAAQTCRWFPAGMAVTAGNANALTIEFNGFWYAGPPLF